MKIKKTIFYLHNMRVAIIWFRKDLRLKNNKAFIKACNNNDYVIPIYILDSNSLLGSAQKWWLHNSLISLEKSLKIHGLYLYLHIGNAIEIFLELIKKYKVSTIYCNRTYEPLVNIEDKNIAQRLLESGVEFDISSGNLLNEPWTIKNSSGGYFKVFTAYWNFCLRHMPPFENIFLHNKCKGLEARGLNISDLHLLPNNPNWAKNFSNYWSPGEEGAQDKLNKFLQHNILAYKKNRDIPFLDATSKLSAHLHFGEISIWEIFKSIRDLKVNNESISCFLSELGWREFSYYLLHHFPELDNKNFNPKFNDYPWENNEEFLKKWQQGKTGYPIVDAGMRELWHTGYMHNRVRMIAASFLIKDLLIDWRIGAAWFLDTLLDADLANNSMSWQWVAGSGVDAVPYFRVFNPSLQMKKFDKNYEYIKKWVPEFHTDLYVRPVVKHEDARLKFLNYYK